MGLDCGAEIGQGSDGEVDNLCLVGEGNSSDSGEGVLLLLPPLLESSITRYYTLHGIS